MPSSPSPPTNQLHSALAEERPSAIRDALKAGAHPLDRNADGKTVWDVVLSSKLSTAASAPTLGEVGTAARDFRDTVIQMAQIPPRSFEEALAMFAYEKQAIERKYSGLKSPGVDFVRDCLGMATQALNPEGMPWAKLYDVVQARTANQFLERRLEAAAAAPLSLSGNTVSIPLQAGEPALHQGDSAGTAPGWVIVQSPVDPQTVKEFMELVKQRVTGEGAVREGEAVEFRLATLSERRERLAESNPPAPETKPSAPKP